MILKLSPPINRLPRAIQCDFSSSRLPLLDRGIIYVIAHVRGGGEMGRQWYEEPNGAKYLCKKHTFNDFVDVARWLQDEKKMTTSELMSTEGRSAGGLLIGASVNQVSKLTNGGVRFTTNHRHSLQRHCRHQSFLRPPSSASLLSTS